MKQSREYRAGKILNYMRGLSLNVCYPISPFTPSPEDKKYFFNSMKEKKETKGRKNEEQEKSEEGEEEGKWRIKLLFRRLWLVLVILFIFKTYTENVYEYSYFLREFLKKSFAIKK